MRFFWIVLIGFSNVVNASVPPAYTLIANEFGIPDKLLYAVALTESLHPEYKKPWPWAANIDGKAFYFESRDEMFLHLSRIARNKSNFDVGIMQTNWKWQKHRFDSLRDATDPLVNIRAGAAYLTELYKKYGSFDTAVGHYHSPGNEVLAEAYRQRVKAKLRLILAGNY